MHGLSRTQAIMSKMAQHLRQEGYETHNLDYPSTTYPIEMLVDIVADQISLICPFDSTRKLHIVAHSMGSIVAHAMIKKYQPKNLGRVVALGPPFQGTPIIDRVRNFWLYLKYNGPAALQLGTDGFGIFHQLGPANYDLGIIAGDRWIFIDWFFAKFWLPSPNDGKVPVSSTFIDGYKDHIVLPIDHVFMPRNPIVMQQTAYYLKNGYFQKTH